MYGVVIWCDAQENKAVIWCEDHGDLAFYRQPEKAADVLLDAGDWVQFDVTTDRHLRFAHNPRLLLEGVSPGLADVLTSASSAVDNSAQPAQSRSSAEIIPFSRPRTPQLADANASATASHA